MPYLPADQNAMIEAVRAWAASKLVGVTVIYGEQDAPSPAYPYATVGLLSPPRQIGMPARSTIDNGSAVTNRIEFDSEFAISIQIFAQTDDPDDPTGLMDGLQASLLTSSTIEALGVAGVVTVASDPPLKLPVIGGAKWIRRAAMTVHLRARTRFDETSSTWLDHASVGGFGPGIFGSVED